MKLLFITQKIDQNDDLLGVYHDWVRELAANSRQVTVICLQKGKVDLPDNVTVLSLGKEVKASRLHYLINFYRYIWHERKAYDTVFVHMNPEYVILGGWLWRWWGKTVVFWYAHYLKTFKLILATKLAHKIVTSVPEAFPFTGSKIVAVGQGVDTKNFKPRTSRPDPAVFKILFLGRLSPVKDLETLVLATDQLAKEGIPFHLTVVGEPPVRDQEYAEQIRNLVTSLHLDSRITFKGRVPHYQTPRVYNQHDVFVNLTCTGSFDKTTLEAMACEELVVVANRAFRNILPPDLQEKLMFTEKDPNDLFRRLKDLATLPLAEREKAGKQLRELVVAKHGLPTLAERLTQVMMGE